MSKLLTDASSNFIYLSGAFSGVCALVLVLSVLIAYAYREPMLGWHAATLSLAMLAPGLGQDAPQLASLLWAVQLPLAAQTLRTTMNATGAMYKPACVLRFLSLGLMLLVGLRLIREEYLTYLLLPWSAAVIWYFFRSWSQSKPWVYWLALSQLALAAHWMMRITSLQGARDLEPDVGALAAIAIYAIAAYLAMVWHSRRRSENALRVEAREKIDPLTGLVMPRVFFDRVDEAMIRSRNLGYACALVLIRVENTEKIVADLGLENNEAVILAASRAIASTLRPQDTAARLSGNRFGVMAEGIAEGATGRLATKIVAHGLRAGEWGLGRCELQFQIAVVEIGQAQITSPALLAQLEEVLRQMAMQAPSHRIRTLPRA